MKIAIITPPGLNSAQKMFMPYLGIGVLNSYLRNKGMQVKVYDLSEEINKNTLSSFKTFNVLNDVEKLQSYITSGNPSAGVKLIIEKMIKKISFKEHNLFAFSLLNRQPSAIYLTLLMSKFLKEKTKSPIVLGGAYSNIGEYSEILLKIMKDYPFIDYCIDATFSGEVPFYLLCKSLEDSQPISKVPNLIYRKNNKIKKTEWQFNRKLVCPNFDGFFLKKYRKNNKELINSKIKTNLNTTKKDILILPYQLMRGCKYNCAFCLKYDKKVEMKKPSLVAAELKNLSKKHKAKYFYFLDRTINLEYNYVDNLCDELIKNKINILWGDCAYFDNLDLNLLKKMREAGAIRLVFGLESASQSTLNYLNKKISLKNVEKILKYSNEAGIWNVIELIIGFPHENQQKVIETINFIKKNKENIDGCYLNTFELKTPSLIQKYPLKYGIKNVKPLKQNMGGFIYTYGNSFDEINGLVWGEKKKQTDMFKNKLEGYLKKFVYLYSDNTTIDDIPLLFYLYDALKKKRFVRKYYAPF